MKLLRDLWGGLADFWHAIKQPEAQAWFAIWVGVWMWLMIALGEL